MPTYRVFELTETGAIQSREYKNLASLLEAYVQVGVEEDSYTIRLHGEPILKGLIGPLSEGKSMVRYETPQAYAVLTRKWADQRRNGEKRAKDAGSG